MFHYEPKNNSNRHYGMPKQSKGKIDNDKQFKDDYSSVKDLKN